VFRLLDVGPPTIAYVFTSPHSDTCVKLGWGEVLGACALCGRFPPSTYHDKATFVADDIDERKSSGYNSKPALHQRPEAFLSSRMRLVTASVAYLWLFPVNSVDAFFFAQTQTITWQRHQLSPVILYYAKTETASSEFPKERKFVSTLLQSSPPSPSVKTTRTASGSTEIRKKLVPLSTNPRLFASSDPLLSKQDSEQLRQWCKENLQPNKTIHPSLFDRRSDELPSLLQRLRDHVDAMVGYDGTGEEVMVRYLSYTTNSGTIHHDHSVSEPCLTTSVLLPDGLHVDTNNGKFFRHWYVCLPSCSVTVVVNLPDSFVWILLISSQDSVGVP
jgi:hypothetical protein